MNKLKRYLNNKSFQKTFFIGMLILAILSFMFRAYVFLDPDFGWHFKMGEYITNFGIPKGDPFSYTMTSFPFVDHEWLTNVLIYQLFSKNGVLSLILLYTVFAFLALFIALSIEKNKDKVTNKGKVLLFFLAAAIFIQYFGIRPQVISWFFLSSLLFVFFRVEIWNKWKFGLPLFLLIWANMHGSFGAAVVILGLLIFLKMVRLRKIVWSDCVVGIVSLAATFINPYGYHAWREVLQQITDSSIHWTINEWTPSFFTFNMPFMLLGSLSTLLIIKYHKKYILEEKGLFIALLFQAIGATRHVPLFTVFAIPITLRGLAFLYHEVRKVRFGERRLLTTYRYCLGVFAVLFVFQTSFSVLSALELREEIFYPKAAIQYLKEHPLEGRLFSEYGWGGYLDWKYPSEKVFIDGRMATWKWEENPESEEGYVFGTYRSMLQGDSDFKPVFEKYNITTVLWPKEKTQKPIDSQVQKLEKILQSFFKKEEKEPFLKRLEKEGWEKVYEDDISIIFRKLNMVQYR